MADFFTSSYAQTVDNAGATVAKLGDNALKTDSPSSKLGTPILGFFTLTVTPASGNMNTNTTSSNSNFAKAVRALQNHCELFYVGAPSTTVLTFMAVRNSMNAGGRGADATYGGTDDTTSIDASPSFENLEEAVADAIGGTPAIAEVTLTGSTLS
jgi:hypothetical protein